jgi:hypothetical protein
VKSAALAFAVLAACAGPKERGHAAPPWPSAPELPPPPGLVWMTIHHETIHARLLVPIGTTPRIDRDKLGFPLVWIDVGQTVTLE